jgi:serine/threonine-protein kinase RsbW
MEAKNIKLSIESKYESVPLIGAAINKLCYTLPVSERDASSIELCVVEAVVNSIKHAYGNDPGHEVSVVFSIYETKLVIEVIDKGKSMAPGLLEERKEFALEFDPEDIDAIPESGRGLAIIQGFMDDVSYQVTESGNYLTMVKEIEHE